MTEVNPTEVHFSEPAGVGEARGVGESWDTPSADVPAVMPGDAETARQQVTLRRAPRYRAFIGTGAVVGAVLAVVLTGLFPGSGRFSTGAVMGYLGVSLALLGALFGGLVAVLADRQHPRRR